MKEASLRIFEKSLLVRNPDDQSGSKMYFCIQKYLACLPKLQRRQALHSGWSYRGSFCCGTCSTFQLKDLLNDGT